MLLKNNLSFKNNNNDQNARSWVGMHPICGGDLRQLGQGGSGHHVA